MAAAVTVKMAVENARKMIDRQLNWLDYEPKTCVEFLRQIIKYCDVAAVKADNGLLQPRKKTKTRHG